MLNTSFPPWPSFTAEEADAARNVILSNRVNYWTGQECREFEREFGNEREGVFPVEPRLEGLPGLGNLGGFGF